MAIGDRSTVPRRCAGRSSGQYLRRHQKSNEPMAYTYSRLYGLQTVGLRFSPFMVPGDARTWHRCFSADLSREDKTDPDIQRRDVYPGFHIYRRYYRRDRHDTRPPGLSGEDVPGAPAVIYNIRSRFSGSAHGFYRTPRTTIWVKPPGKNSSACNPEMCIRHGQTPPNSIPIIITGPPPHSGKGIEQFALWFKKMKNLWIIIYSNRPYVTLSKQR